MNGATAGSPAPLEALLALDPIGEGRWQSRQDETNQNGRVFGGQSMGQALRAALLAAPPGRMPTMMQAVFLQRASPDRPMALAVSPLQAGKRFTTLAVLGSQGDRAVLHAQVTCAQALDGPGHALATTAPAGEDPECLPGLADAPGPFLAALARMGGYGSGRYPSIEFRIPDIVAQLSTPGPDFRYWVRAAGTLAPDDGLHAAAFAYLSDWWLNFCALRPHLADLGGRRMSVTSLNHGIWLHRQPFPADQWLHVQAASPHAAAGRGLTIGQVHDRAGRHLATTSQDCLMSYVS